MQNKKNCILTIIAILTLLVAVIGASFAYFSATASSESQEIITGKLSVVASSSAITESNIKPTTWDNDQMINNINNIDIAKLPFTVNTSGTTVSSEYDIFLNTTGVALTETDSSNNELVGGTLSDIKWVLIKTINNSIVSSGDFIDGNAVNRKITSTPIPINYGIDSYKLLFYISNDEEVQNKLQNVSISATVSVEGKQK